MKDRTYTIKRIGERFVDERGIPCKTLYVEGHDPIVVAYLPGRLPTPYVGGTITLCSDGCMVLSELVC